MDNSWDNVSKIMDKMVGTASGEIGGVGSLVGENTIEVAGKIASGDCYSIRDIPREMLDLGGSKMEYGYLDNMKSRDGVKISA